MVNGMHSLPISSNDVPVQKICREAFFFLAYIPSNCGRCGGRCGAACLPAWVLHVPALLGVLVPNVGACFGGG